MLSGKHGGDMTDRDREEAVTAMCEGILSAFYAMAQEEHDIFSDCQTFAHAALASLEATGFKVVRDAKLSSPILSNLILGTSPRDKAISAIVSASRLQGDDSHRVTCSGRRSSFLAISAFVMPFE